MSEDITPEDIGAVIPALNVNTQPQPEERENLITDDSLLGIYAEILQNIRDDRQELNEFMANFADMVVNEGDPSSASKEALVNLVKIKMDSADKMSKIADLMTRMKTKDPWPRYLTAKQENNIQINSLPRRELIKQIEQDKKKKKAQS